MNNSSSSRNEQIALRKSAALASYPRIWRQILLDWRYPQPADQAWLMYSANYLFRCGAVGWAMDPLTLLHRLDNPDLPDLAEDLDGLAFILLTHSHADHFSPQVIRSLRDMPVRWVIPPHLLPLVAEAGGLPEDRLIVPRALETLEIDGFHITPFDGLHWELISAGGKNASLPEARGVPATGYLVEYQGKRWLFPGDTRAYDTSQLPAFGPVDILFAHVWLGRGMANQPCPPLCDDFCRFCLALQPRRIVLTHLDEWGREALDLWDLDHARLIISTLKAQSPDLVVQAARFGDEIRLE